MMVKKEKNPESSLVRQTDLAAARLSLFVCVCYIYSTKSWKKLMFDLLSRVFATARAFCYLLVSEELCNGLLLELISFLSASDATFLLCFVRLT